MNLSKLSKEEGSAVVEWALIVVLIISVALVIIQVNEIETPFPALPPSFMIKKDLLSFFD